MSTTSPPGQRRVGLLDLVAERGEQLGGLAHAADALRVDVGARARSRRTSRSAAARARAPAGREGLGGRRRPRRVARPRSRRGRRAAAAVSATVRVSTPSWTGSGRRAPAPREIRPRCGLSPTRPQHAAGMRVEPPPSLPWAIGHHARGDRRGRAAGRAAGRPVEVPRVAGRRRSGAARCVGRIPNSGRLVMPDDDEAGVAEPAHDVVRVRRADGRRGSASRVSCAGPRPRGCS